MARYYRKALKYDNLVVAYRLNEESKTTVYDESSNGLNATSSGLMRSWTDRVVLGPDGSKCAKFDGSASYVDIYAAQASLPTTAGSVVVWAAAENAILEGTTERKLVYCAADANNFWQISFDTTAQRFIGEVKGGGTSKSSTGLVYNVGYGPQWHCYALTWSEADDQVKFFIDGNQQGSTATSLGSWAGSFNSDTTALATSSVGSPADLWNGWLANCFIYSAALSHDQILELSRIS